MTRPHRSCLKCGAPISVSGRGRPRLFCSAKCRRKIRQEAADGNPATCAGHPTPATRKPAQAVLANFVTLLPGVVPDDRWPDMYRVWLVSGLSDMMNLPRANDLARSRSGLVQ